MTPTTKQNLRRAMECEALSHATYTQFAACARMNDRTRLAKLFQATADLDRLQHFRKELGFGDLLCDDKENLSAAIASQREQIEMYLRFACEALTAGDTEVAALFEWVAKDEKVRLRMFESQLEELASEAGCRQISVA